MSETPEHRFCSFLTPCIKYLILANLKDADFVQSLQCFQIMVGCLQGINDSSEGHGGVKLLNPWQQEADKEAMGTRIYPSWSLPQGPASNQTPPPNTTFNYWAHQWMNQLHIAPRGPITFQTHEPFRVHFRSTIQEWARQKFSTRTSGKSEVRPTLWFCNLSQASSLSNGDKIRYCCFKHPDVIFGCSQTYIVMHETRSYAMKNTWSK